MVLVNADVARKGSLLKINNIVNKVTENLEQQLIERVSARIEDGHLSVCHYTESFIVEAKDLVEKEINKIETKFKNRGYKFSYKEFDNDVWCRYTIIIEW